MERIILRNSDFSLHEKYEQILSLGDSRWAEVDEIRAVKHYENISPSFDDISSGGIPIINDSKKGLLLVDSSDTSSVVIGSTRSMKTRRICFQTVFTLLAAKESVVCYDPKGEIYEMTSGFASESHQVYVLNLRNPDYSNSWNLLGAAWDLHHSGDEDAAAEIINDLATVISNSKGNSLKDDPYWTDMSVTLFCVLANILIRIFPKEKCNIRSLLALRSSSLFEDECQELREFADNYEKNFNENLGLLYNQINAFLVAPEITRGTALSVFDANMRLFFSQNNITDILSDDDLDFTQLCTKPSIVYVIAPDEKKTYGSLVSQFLKQMLTVFIRVCHAEQEDDIHKDGKLNRRMNFVLDEFAQIEKIVDFDSICAASSSRNIRFVIFLQNLYQLTTVYGQAAAETILDNCPNMFYLATNEPNLLNRLGTLCGIGRDGKPLITPYVLHRLNSTDGRVLVISKLHHPFVTWMDDICCENSFFLRLQKKSAPKPHHIVHNIVTEDDEYDIEDYLYPDVKE